MKFNTVCKLVKNNSKIFILALIGSFFSSASVFAQSGPGGPGGGGGGPDVPFDDDMNIAFLVIGVLFAAFVVFKQIRKRTVTQ